jgi:hypothetical protein
MKARGFQNLVLGCLVGVCIALATAGLWKAFAAFAASAWVLDAIGRTEFVDEGHR